MIEDPCFRKVNVIPYLYEIFKHLTLEIIGNYLFNLNNLNIYYVEYVFDFSCVADNALGRTKKYIEISGRPGPAEFISPTFSGSLEFYNLTWSVESIPPLEEIRLLYRRLMVWVVNNYLHHT